MVKIFAISMVKNEMDIIESFVRYNMNILDGMIILDNGSTDDTLKILNQLKEKENYPIFILEDENSEFDKVVKVTNLLKKAVKDFDADIIIPLDADEFIIASDQGNPRSIFEKIEPNSYYLVLWKTYIPYLGNKEDEKFIPSKITYSRNKSTEKFYKVVIPKNLVKEYDIKIPRGSHDISYDLKYNDLIKKVYNNDLRIAHFPLRSVEQAISKVSVGWINALSSDERKENQSHHWKKIFNQLKSNEKIEKDDVVKYASEYALINDVDVKLKEDPIDLAFCRNIEIKYTDKNVNPMANLLERCEDLSLSYLNFKKERIEEKKRCQNKIQECQNKIQESQNKIQEYQNSTSWIVTSPIRKINNYIKKIIKL